MWFTDFNKNVSKGFEALYGVEELFDCAAMCTSSVFYSFSEVG
jgi:hypothetical protein